MDQKTIAINMMVTGPFPAQMAAAGASVQTFGAQASSGMAKAQTSMAKFGKVASKVGTFALIGVAAGLALSAKAAIDFESSFTGIRKTVDTTETGFQMLAKGIRQMATEIPIGVNELNRIGELGGQLGVDPSNLLAFTDTIAKIGVTTTLMTDTAAMGFARIDNVMQLGGKSFDRMGASIVDLGNNFAATEDEILTFATRIAPIGATVGLATDEVLAIATAFTSVGVPAERGGTAIQKTFIKMAEAAKNGGVELDIFSETAGMTAEAFATMFEDDPAAAFTAFVEGLGRVSDEGGNVFAVLDGVELSNQRVISSLLAMANAEGVLQDALDLSVTAWGDNTALTEEAEKRFETTASALVILKNKVQDIAISLGSALLPALNTFIDGGVSIADFFANLDGGMQAVIIGIPTFLAALAVAATHPAVAAIIAAGAATYQIGVWANQAKAGTDVVRQAAMGLNAELDPAALQDYLSAQGMKPEEMRKALEDAGMTMADFGAAVNGTEEEWDSFYENFMSKQPVFSWRWKFWEDSPSEMLQRTRKAWIDAGTYVTDGIAGAFETVDEQEQALWDRFNGRDRGTSGDPAGAEPTTIRPAILDIDSDVDAMFDNYVKVFNEAFDETDDRIRGQIDLWYEFGDALEINFGDLLPNLMRQVKATGAFESLLGELDLDRTTEEFIRNSFNTPALMEAFVDFRSTTAGEFFAWIKEVEAIMGPNGPLMQVIFDAFSRELPNLEFTAGAQLLAEMSSLVDEIYNDPENLYDIAEVWLGVIQATLIRGGPELAPQVIETLKEIFGDGGIPGVELTIQQITDLAIALGLLPANTVVELEYRLTYTQTGERIPEPLMGYLPEPPTPKEWEPKAMGGSVFTGNPYMVGERGPELFVPFVNGTIIPNDRVGSVAGPQNNISLQFHVDSASTIPDIQTALVVSGVADLVDLRKAGL